MDRLTEMEVFATVVEQGGFTDAARELGMSKSAVSKHITALEGRLGARLLNRTTRKVNPTEIGLVYYDRTNRVRTEADAADALVAELHGVPTGVLTVAAPPDLAVHVIAPQLGGFLELYPGISVRIELEHGKLDMIGEGIDVAIRCGHQPDSTLLARKLFTYGARLVASPAYIARHGEPRLLDDLKDHRLLTRSSRPGKTWRLVSCDGDMRVIPVDPVLTVNDGQALLDAAISGLGIARLPGFLCDDAIEMGLLVDAMPALPVMSTDVTALHASGKFTQPKVRAFVDYIAGALAPRRH
ncbi:LysR family transcriptional regulator [Phaeobacter marinintestinus]|uniref:LysR family transcriptional regulator n=1 Tax=Falsiphaeobacter marinintestinus TaxID=1492905 RepID=UPI0011B48ABC|nr:LysR family transcriptional regulator [Phaeobacter marinintestinus]